MIMVQERAIISQPSKLTYSLSCNTPLKRSSEMHSK